MTTMRAILAILLTAQLAAQEAPAPKSTLKFEATSQLVVINVAAKDKNGNPIEGLKASDFSVTEDGKAQQIRVFEYQKLEGETLAEPALKARPEEAAATAPAAKAAVSLPISPARPGEIKYKDRRLLVLFFDQAGMPVTDQLRAQQAAIKF